MKEKRRRGRRNYEGGEEREGEKGRRNYEGGDVREGGKEENIMKERLEEVIRKKEL